jgi:tRNA (guanine-N(1)-)-methyltransferase
MRIDILTLFKEQFNGFLETSIIKRAIDRKQVEINLVDIRDFVQNKHRQVDDTVYGGGSGMVIMVEPVVLAIESVKTKDSKVILLTPSGEVYNQDKAISLSKEKHLIIICGHYEGIDERIKNFIDMEISIGDFVLTGGEIPSMVLVDSITRLLDGVITKESLESESFNDNLLDYAVYTKPRNFRGYEVPEVLVSGNHELIRKYREEERIRRTNERRKDLIDNVK